MMQYESLALMLKVKQFIERSKRSTTQEYPQTILLFFLGWSASRQSFVFKKHLFGGTRAAEHSNATVFSNQWRKFK